MSVAMETYARNGKLKYDVMEISAMNSKFM